MKMLRMDVATFSMLMGKRLFLLALISSRVSRRGPLGTAGFMFYSTYIDN
jgi:hypothetical protein